MSSPILTGPKRILARWRQRHQPVLQLEPVMTDDDVDGVDCTTPYYWRSLAAQLDAVATACEASEGAR